MKMNEVYSLDKLREILDYDYRIVDDYKRMPEYIFFKRYKMSHAEVEMYIIPYIKRTIRAIKELTMALRP